MRISVKLRRRWRMISCPAAKQMKAVKPSMATDIPSWTYSAIASFRESRLSVIYALLSQLEWACSPLWITLLLYGKLCDHPLINMRHVCFGIGDEAHRDVIAGLEVQ